LQATVVFGRATLSDDGRDLPTHLRRRAERVLSQPERNALLQSHAQLALLMDEDNQANYSLSRRAGYFAVAVCIDGKIGVDVEQVIQTDDIDTVASCYFPADLYQSYLALPKGERPRQFAAGWSVLESVAKLCSVPLEEARENLISTVLYQCWIADDMVLSVALDQDVELSLTSLAGCQCVFTRI
jgi:hypothetical protein